MLNSQQVLTNTVVHEYLMIHEYAITHHHKIHYIS